ncbi:putative Purine nucleoside phosphorylase 1 [Paratrimastix pyriformis]|uniref:purine-nucleoside phosphorylase n=1 Tax=Paratrimastix pyriformis TaxID=342808 RepID=A0ABQ8UQF9_9EUKA|nr:putative Purine nucleoside phosphorylase 1 [Paratrimastix pyriformis]
MINNPRVPKPDDGPVPENLREKLLETVGMIRARVPDQHPVIGIILGTGLGSVAKCLQIEAEIRYEEIPWFAWSTVEGHAGKLLFGKLAGVPVVCMQGRFHRYEGWSMKNITYPVRAMHYMGVKVLIVSNAAGCLNPQWNRGDIMLISDHVNLFGENPLVGHNDSAIGPRFPDMFNCYERHLRALVTETALANAVQLRQGVYAGLLGPNLETEQPHPRHAALPFLARLRGAAPCLFSRPAFFGPASWGRAQAAEYRWLRQGVGADAVGMSTVPEVIVAVHIGLKVVGFSVLTDMCLPDSLEPTSHTEILRAAQTADEKMARLMLAVIPRLAAELAAPAPAPAAAN